MGDDSFEERLELYQDGYEAGRDAALEELRSLLRRARAIAIMGINEVPTDLHSPARIRILNRLIDDINNSIGTTEDTGGVAPMAASDRVLRAAEEFEAIAKRYGLAQREEFSDFLQALEIAVSRIYGEGLYQLMRRSDVRMIHEMHDKICGGEEK